jgi:hypothetical protein
MGKRELIERADVDEGSITLCHLGSVSVLSHWLMMARGFAKPAYCLLVQTLEGILHAEEGADDCEHNVVAGWERIVSAGRPENTTVRSPELADVTEIGVAGRKMIALEICLGLVAPYDVPLGIGEEGIYFWASVVGNTCCLGRMTKSLGSRAEEQSGRRAMNGESDSHCKREEEDARKQAYYPLNKFTRARRVLSQCVCLR